MICECGHVFEIDARTDELVIAKICPECKKETKNPNYLTSKGKSYILTRDILIEVKK